MATKAAEDRDDADSSAALDADRSGDIRLRPLIAFLITATVVIFVLGLLPTALHSMVTELQSQDSGQIYDLYTGQAEDPDRPVGADMTFVNISVTNLDEARRMAELTVSGHRACEAACVPLVSTLYAIGDDVAKRRGLPPSASIDVPGEPGAYTFTVELPVQGRPQRYPFDEYTLMLGITTSALLPNGREQRLDVRGLAQRRVTLTLEDLVTRLNMSPPRPVDPATVRSPTDPTDFLLVNELKWERPEYLRITTILLVTLISASGVFALGLRSLHELVLGIGGIILGIWGVRSVVVQSPLPDVTLIDLILAFVMLALLLALAIRAAWFFYGQSGLRYWRRGMRGLR